MGYRGAFRYGAYMQLKDLSSVLLHAVDAAKAAGKRIEQGYEEVHHITVKGDKADRVTQVDIEAQNIIEQHLAAIFPECAFFGEEDEQEETPDSEWRWVVDPLDGTSNFIQGLPHVGVSIALEYQREPVLGVVHFPLLRETYTAVRDQGAFCNGNPIQVQHCNTMANAVIAEIYSDRVHRGRSVSYPPSLTYRKFGSAITSLAYVAKGSIQGTALRCCRWDIAAAVPIIREAGGSITWEEDDPENERGTLTCIAAVPGIMEEFTTFVQAEYDRAR